MPMPLSGAVSVVSGAFKALLDMGRGRNSVNRVQQKITIFVMSSVLALQWIEENVTKYRESRAPTVESIHAIDYSRMLEFFEMRAKYSLYPWGRGTCGVERR